MNNCLICERIELIKKNENPYFIFELETGYVVIGDHQFFKGYTLFLLKTHVTELHFLEKDFRIKFLYEMSLVGEAVFNAFKPDKLNYELLGNGDAHMHWHIFPRFEGDGDVKGPVWWTSREKMFNDKSKLSEHDLQLMKEKVHVELLKLLDKE